MYNIDVFVPSFAPSDDMIRELSNSIGRRKYYIRLDLSTISIIRIESGLWLSVAGIEKLIPRIFPVTSHGFLFTIKSNYDSLFTLILNKNVQQLYKL